MANLTIILAVASVFAAPCFARGMKMKDDCRVLAEFFWYTIGSFIIMGALMVWISGEGEMLIQYRILIGFVGAVFGALSSLTFAEWIHPTPVAAQLKQDASMNDKITQNVTSHNQQGGITAGTVNIAPQKLDFSEDLGQKLLRRMPDKSKSVTMISAGNITDQAIADRYEAFLRQNGFAVVRMKTGQLISPDLEKISVGETAEGYEIHIAPSAP